MARGSSSETTVSLTERASAFCSTGVEDTRGCGVLCNNLSYDSIVPLLQQQQQQQHLVDIIIMDAVLWTQQSGSAYGEFYGRADGDTEDCEWG